MHQIKERENGFRLKKSAMGQLSDTVTLLMYCNDEVVNWGSCFVEESLITMQNHFSCWKMVEWRSFERI